MAKDKLEESYTKLKESLSEIIEKEKADKLMSALEDYVIAINDCS